MTVKVSVYIATSLDGFIARRNGEIDWLTGGEAGQDYGYADFMSTIDCVVMGRNTYEKVLTFGGWPYEKRVIVLTSRDLTVAPELTTRVEALNVSPQELIAELERRGVHHIYLDGGATIQRFLRETLVDEMTIATIPVLIGDGLPLFGPLKRDIQLQLFTSNSFSNGFVQSKYKVR
jgi:dihydrofolate reductase